MRVDKSESEALRTGETPERIFALSAWWESPLFTEEERAALSVTEEVTRIADQGLTEAVYQQARMHFSENELAQIIMQVVVINAWNRIAISTHMVHPKNTG
jgi:alkylhydroperoxidase family enzyme